MDLQEGGARGAGDRRKENTRQGGAEEGEGVACFLGFVFENYNDLRIKNEKPMAKC